VGEGTAIAARVLRDFGISLKDTRKAVQSLIGRGPGYSPPEIPFTPKVKAIFEKAFQEARQLGHNFISPEHILLSLIREPDNLGAKILLQMGLDLEKVRTEVLKRLGENEAVGVAANPGQGYGFNNSNQRATLEEFGTNLTKLAAEGKLDPMIGRSKEVERVIQILGRRTKNNPVLVGEPGVGKTAIAEGLAQRIVTKEAPEMLHDKQVIMIDMGSLFAGTRFRGEFEERIKSILKEVRQAKNIILVIDELHTLIGAGSLSGSLDAANLMKPALARVNCNV
jgi:ATP-dependent Clp protease ATP-binding subunit ClpC